MSRDISLRRLGADTRLFRHSAPSFERALVIGEWSSSGSRCFVSSNETVRFFFPPVVPFHCRDGAMRFLKQTSRRLSAQISGNSWSYWRLVAYDFLWLSK